MKSKLAILLWRTAPDLPHACATPFFHAAAAAAMDVEVEIHFSSRSVLLLVEGVAANLRAGIDQPMTIYEHMQQATRFGAKLYACSDALAAQGVDCAAMVPELAGIAGAASFLGSVLDPEWAALVF